MPQNDQPRDTVAEKDSTRWCVWVAWGLVAVGLVPLGIAIVQTASSAMKMGDMGSFLQGTMGALWTLASFLFIYVTFIQQQKGMKRQWDELESQKAQLALQNFEATFFHMINLHNQMVNSMQEESGHPGEIIRGRDCFRYWYDELKEFYRGVHPESMDEPVVLQNAIRQLYETYQGDLSYYLGHLYAFLKFVSLNCPMPAASVLPTQVREEEKTMAYAKYTSMIRAQLSSYEVVLVLYLCSKSNRWEKLKGFLTDFSLLGNIDLELLFRGGEHANALFEPRAYQRTEPWSLKPQEAAVAIAS
jgi:hypothetical protein